MASAAAFNRAGFFLSVPFYLLAAGALTLFVLAVIGNSAWPEASGPAFIAAAFTGYLAFEVRREINARGLLALVSPAVLVAFVHFSLSYSVPIGSTFFNDYTFLQLTFRSNDSEFMGWISYTMAMVGVSAVAYWRGYRFVFAGRATNFMIGALSSTRLMRTELNLRAYVAVCLFAVAIGARLVQIRLGVFGFGSDAAALIEYAEYRPYLDYAVSGGRLALFLIALHTFRPDAKKGFTWPLVLIAATLLEVAFGLLSGFKGQTTFSVITVALAYFVVHGRIPMRFIVATAVVLYLAYVVVEPFRDLRNRNLAFDSTSIVSMSENLIDAINVDSSQQSFENILFQIAGRTNLVVQATLALRFRDVNEDLGPAAPPLLTLLLLSPVYAFIPRIVWADKPVVYTGTWFSQYVHGGDPLGLVSVAMGATGYFYLAGGIAVVIIGFFVLGLLHRILFDALTSFGAGGWLVYLCLVPGLAVIPSEVAAHLTGTVQLLLIALVIQVVVLRRDSNATIVATDWRAKFVK